MASSDPTARDPAAPTMSPTGASPDEDDGMDAAADGPGEAARTARVALLATAVVLLVGIGLILWARSGFATPPQTFMTGPAAMLAITLATICQTCGGVILAVRRPANMVGWVVLTFSVAIAITVFVDGYLALVGTGWAAPIDPSVVALLPGLISFSLGTFTAVALGMVFPEGHVVAPRYRPLIAAAAFGALLFSLGVAGTPGPLLWFPTYDNPIPAPGGTIWPTLARVVIGPGLLMVGVVGTSAALLERYRRSGPVGRLQLRWYVAGAVALSVGFVLYIVALLTLPPASPWGELIMTLFFLSAAIPPVAMVVAILRYRLFDIDVIIGRAFVYGALTAILAGLYAASIRFFNALFVGLTGQSSEAELVITTLILATTFTPIKGRLERFVESRMAGATLTAQPVASTTEAMAVAPGPRASVDEVLRDPAFAAMLDERIGVALDAHLSGGGAIARSEDVTTKQGEP